MLLAGWRRAGEDLRGRGWMGLGLGRATWRTSHSCTSRAEYSRGPVGPVLASGKSAQKGPCGAQDRPARWGRAESRAEASGHPLAPPRAASYPLRIDSKLPRQSKLRVSCWQRGGGPMQARAHPEGARSPPSSVVPAGPADGRASPGSRAEGGRSGGGAACAEVGWRTGLGPLASLVTPPLHSDPVCSSASGWRTLG